MFSLIPYIFEEMLTGNPKKDLVYSIRVVPKRKGEKFFGAETLETTNPQRHWRP